MLEEGPETRTNVRPTIRPRNNFTYVQYAEISLYGDLLHYIRKFSHIEQMWFCGHVLRLTYLFLFPVSQCLSLVLYSHRTEKNLVPVTICVHTLQDIHSCLFYRDNDSEHAVKLMHCEYVY